MITSTGTTQAALYVCNTHQNRPSCLKVVGENSVIFLKRQIERKRGWSIQMWNERKRDNWILLSETGSLISNALLLMNSCLVILGSGQTSPLAHPLDHPSRFTGFCLPFSHLWHLCDQKINHLKWFFFDWSLVCVLPVHLISCVVCQRCLGFLYLFLLDLGWNFTFLCFWIPDQVWF